MSTTGRRKVSTTIYITPEQNDRLRLLSDRTKVAIAEYIRQGIDHVLEKHAAPQVEGHPFALSDADLDALEQG